MKPTAIVIGSGIGGLAGSIRLASKGYDVTIFEKNSYTGGKIAELRHNGFRFDKGPSLLTLPDLIEELFAICSKDPSNYFPYQRLEMSCKYFYNDGTIINAWQDFQKFLQEIEQKTGENRVNTEKFFKKSKQLYDITAKPFLFSSLHKSSNYYSKEFLKTIANVLKLDAFTTMHKRNRSRFKSEKIIQLFDRYATYNGSNPYKTPATLNIIPHLEHSKGTWYPERGIYSIAEALTRLATEVGVKIKLNSKADEIILANNCVKGIRVGKHFYPAEIVLSNIDIESVYNKLIPTFLHPPAVNHGERSTSAIIYFWGVKINSKNLQLHNILFSGNYKNEFDCLFNTKTVTNDPTVYIYISSKIVRSDAPEGYENWYVMVNAPADSGQDWNSIIAKTRANIISKIERILNIEIEPLIEYEHSTTPKTIESETGSTRGSLYGLSSNSMFSAFNRHPNFNKQLKNLYFTGGTVHPGGGIPLCLASAKIADKEVITQINRK